MFAANAELDVAARRAATLGGDAHQFADAILIERLERILFENIGFIIVGQETARVIAAEAEGGLCQVIGAKAEELRRLGDFPGLKRRTRQFDHRADQIVELDT